jgi:hypothetical protein
MPPRRRTRLPCISPAAALRRCELVVYIKYPFGARRSAGLSGALHERLVLVGEFQKLEVGPRDQHVVGLAALLAAEIEAVSAAESQIFVGAQADVGVALLDQRTARARARAQ